VVLNGGSPPPRAGLASTPPGRDAARSPAFETATIRGLALLDFAFFVVRSLANGASGARPRSTSGWRHFRP